MRMRACFRFPSLAVTGTIPQRGHSQGVGLDAANFAQVWIWGTSYAGVKPDIGSVGETGCGVFCSRGANPKNHGTSLLATLQRAQSATWHAIPPQWQYDRQIGCSS